MINKVVFAIVAAILTGCPPSTALAALPDLIPNAARLKLTIEYSRISIPRENCAYVEGCLRGTTRRKLLHFDTGVGNIGKADLVIGNPTMLPNMFTFSPCHSHYHLKAFARYRLFTRDWRPVVKASKQGFCLRDDRPFRAGGGPERRYTCDYQGISRGWQDVYDKSLDCQWLDISGIPPGTYYLQVTINPDRVFKESNYRNNKAIIPITIPRLAR